MEVGQVYNPKEHWQEVWTRVRASSLLPNAKLCFEFLAHWQGEQPPTASEIGAALGIGTRQVMNCLSDLRTAGLVSPEKSGRRVSFLFTWPDVCTAVQGSPVNHSAYMNHSAQVSMHCGSQVAAGTMNRSAYVEGHPLPPSSLSPPAPPLSLLPPTPQPEVIRSGRESLASTEPAAVPAEAARRPSQEEPIRSQTEAEAGSSGKPSAETLGGVSSAPPSRLTPEQRREACRLKALVTGQQFAGLTPAEEHDLADLFGEGLRLETLTTVLEEDAARSGRMRGSLRYYTGRLRDALANQPAPTPAPKPRLPEPDWQLKGNTGRAIAVAYQLADDADVTDLLSRYQAHLEGLGWPHEAMEREVRQMHQENRLLGLDRSGRHWRKPGQGFSFFSTAR